MSFNFTKEDDSGVEVTYWELISVMVDRLNKVATWTVGGWISKAAKDDGKTPEMTLDFHKSGDEYPLDSAGAAETALISIFETISKADARFQ